MKPVPPAAWARLQRLAAEFEAELLTGNIILELHFDKGKLSMHKVNSVTMGNEKPLTPGGKRA